MGISDFEDVFKHIGGFGPYQWVIFGFVCLVNFFFTSMYFGQIFMVLTPPHWCKLPPDLEKALIDILGPNITQEQFKNLSIPLNSKGLGEYEQCKRYDINVGELKNMTLGSSTNWSTVDCDYGWEYDFSSYYPTITSQLNWVCSDDWKPPFAQSVFFISCIIGVPAFGWMADYYGRIPIIVITNVIGGFFGVVSSFSNSFVMFCVLRFFVGLAFDSQFFVIYTLGLEYVSAPYRSIVANVPIMIFLSGSMALMPWLAYYIHDWTTFGVVIYAPMLICIVVPFFMPESARWLIGKGKLEKVVQVITKAGKVNRKELSKEFISEFKNYVEREIEKKPARVITWFDLLKTPNLRKRFVALCFLWLTITLVYDGFMRNSENIGYDFFVTFTIMGAVELPADLLTIFSIEWIGRKSTIILTMVLCGVFSAVTIWINQEQVSAILTISIAGRFMITMAMNVVMQYVMEVLPTVGRAQGSAAIHTIGFLMIFVSPYIVYFGKMRFWIPYAVWSFMAMFAAISVLFLPETLGENLPDSLEDGENYFSDQPIIYNPFSKFSKRRIKNAEGKENPSFTLDTKI